MPVREPRLVRTPALDFAHSLVDANRSSHRRGEVYGTLYKSVMEYTELFPDVRIFEPSNDFFYPYFRAFRKPSLQEIRENVAPKDAITGRLLELGGNGDTLVRAMAYDELCGHKGFQELYAVREVWLLLLEVRNVSDEAVRLNSALGMAEVNQGHFSRPFVAKHGTHAEVLLPASPLDQGESAVIPLAVALSPLDVRAPGADWTEDKGVRTGEIQSVGPAQFGPIARQIDLVGPAFWPELVIGTINDTKVDQPVHEFNFDHSYVIDRAWEAGCCPHLFFELTDGSKRYARELFASHPNSVTRESVVAPNEARMLMIAELEHEVTEIVSIKTGTLNVENRTLRRGESITVPVHPGERVVVEGRYCPMPRSLKRQSPLFQNDLIRMILVCDSASMVDNRLSELEG